MSQLLLQLFFGQPFPAGVVAAPLHVWVLLTWRVQAALPARVV